MDHSIQVSETTYGYNRGDIGNGHLVADVHQPLHAGYLDDKGGNKYQLQVFGRGSNLHALWTAA